MSSLEAPAGTIGNTFSNGVTVNMGGGGTYALNSGSGGAAILSSGAGNIVVNASGSGNVTLAAGGRVGLSDTTACPGGAGCNPTISVSPKCGWFRVHTPYGGGSDGYIPVYCP